MTKIACCHVRYHLEYLTSSGQRCLSEYSGFMRIVCQERMPLWNSFFTPRNSRSIQNYYPARNTGTSYLKRSIEHGAYILTLLQFQLKAVDWTHPKGPGKNLNTVTPRSWKHSARYKEDLYSSTELHANNSGSATGSYEYV